MKRLLIPALLLALAACGNDNTMPVPHVLSPDTANHVALAYSPDGSHIAWWAPEGEMWRLWTARADLSAPRKIPVLTRQTDQSLVWSPDGSRFVIGAAMNSVLPALYVVDTAGTARRVTSDSVFESPTNWNPDGRRIAFLTVVRGEVFTMVVNVDSGLPYRLIPDERRPNIALWSPDGAHMAVMVLNRGQVFVSIGDSAGANRRPISAEGFEHLAGPGLNPWSPDSKSLVYISARSGTEDLWLAFVDGTPPRQLTNDVRDDNQPVWSPDGRWIAFHSNRGLQADLWVVPAAGGAARRITDDRLAERLVGWRPGANELLYDAGRTSRTLWRYTLADSSERQLTPDSLDTVYYGAARDGRAAVLVDRGGGVNDLAVVSARGDSIRALLRDARADGVQWSPDATRLLFNSDRGGSQDIWVMDAAGGAPRQLTRFPTRELNGKWSADGATIQFFADREATWGDIWQVPASGGEPVRLTHDGQVSNFCQQPHRRDELLVVTISRAQGAFALSRVGPDGRLTPIWDRTTTACGVVSPAGDSLVTVVGGAGGALVSMLLPLTGRPGRQLLRAGEQALDWSPDGRHVLYQMPAGNGTDYGILNVADGTTRQITHSSANEVGGEYAADGSAIFFRREVPVNRLTSVDISRVLARHE